MEAPCREESLPLHVKNPLHYSYKSRGKPRCSGPPAHPQYSTIILCKEVCTQKEEEEGDTHTKHMFTQKIEKSTNISAQLASLYLKYDESLKLK